MTLEHAIRRALVYKGDAHAVARCLQTRSAKPLVRRALRREYGRQTGRLAAHLFPPVPARRH